MRRKRPVAQPGNKSAQGHAFGWGQTGDSEVDAERGLRVTRDDGVFFDRPGVAVLKWDPTSESVYVEWQGWADSTEFALLLEAGLRALREHHGSRWLADCRNMRTIKESDQEWIDRSWFPRALAAGLRRMAVLMPKSGLTKMNVEDILGRVPATKLAVAYFETIEEAKEWLTRPTTSPPNGREASPATCPRGGGESALSPSWLRGSKD